MTVRAFALSLALLLFFAWSLGLGFVFNSRVIFLGLDCNPFILGLALDSCHAFHIIGVLVLAFFLAPVV